MTSFDKFTDRARRAMTTAQEEAQHYSHDYLGTEHILLGVVAETEGAAARVLAALGVEQAQVREAIEAVVGRGSASVHGEIALLPRAKASLELAVDEARRMGHHFIGTEHLLLGLLRQGDSVAAVVLGHLGVEMAAVREQLESIWLDSAQTPRPIRRMVEVALDRARGRGQRDGGETASGRGDAASPKANVITCRITDSDLAAIDALVESGVRTTRSDAAAWLIGTGIAANRELFDKLFATIEQIRQLRADAQAIVNSERGARGTE